MLAVAEKAKLGQCFGLIDQKEDGCRKHSYGNVE